MKFSSWIKEDMKPNNCYKCGKKIEKYNGYYLLGANALICADCVKKTEEKISDYYTRMGDAE